MKNLFDAQAFLEIKDRIDKLTVNDSPKWGKMSVDQMLAHCQFPFEVALQKQDFGLKPNFLINFFFKKSMHNDKPWRKGLPTVPKFKVTETKVFVEEKQKLLRLVNEFYAKRAEDNLPDHPSFGHFTKEQWGQLEYKHLDHHLRQFGV
ncbi:MAG: DUF1569 domain-containing protein [Leeuwenhoekiella sp.]